MAPKIKVQDNLVSLSMQRVGQNKILDALTDIGKDEKARAEIIKTLKKMEKDGDISKDEHKKREGDIQKLTDDMIKKVDDALAVKEKEILGN